MSHVDWGFTVEPKEATPRLFNQVHGDRIIEVPHPEPVPDADGAYTLQRGVRLHAFSADCIPLLFFTEDPEGPIAAVHSGWRGTLRGVVPRLLDRLSDWRDQLQVIVGPSILGCCFEVREDFIEEFRGAGRPIEPFLENRDGRIFCHLSRFLMETQLRAIPVSLRNLDHHRCTYCSQPNLPSFRRNKSTDPHIKAWIEKK